MLCHLNAQFPMTHITVAALRMQRKIHNNTKLSFKWDLLMLFVTISLFFKYARQKMAKWRSLCKIKHNLNKLAWHWYKCGSNLLEAGVWVSCLRMYVLPWRTNSAQTVAVSYTTASTCKVNINKHKWTTMSRRNAFQCSSSLFFFYYEVKRAIVLTLLLRPLP